MTRLVSWSLALMIALSTVAASSTSFGIMSNTKNATNAPGIGAGEPFNMQLAAKLIF